MNQDLPDTQLGRLLAAWQLRVEADLRSVMPALEGAGADPRILVKPDFLGADAPPEARARVLVRRGTANRAAAALSAAGWRSVAAGTAGQVVLTREGVLIELTESAQPNRTPRNYPWSAANAALRDYLAVSVGWRRARSAVFDGLPLRVPRGVFYPVPDTAKLATALIDALGPVMNPLVVDVGTGTGALALALAARRSDASVLGTDPARRAVLTARRNARALRLRNVRFCRGALLECLPQRWRGRVNAIITNLPYVPPLVRSYEDLAGSGWRGPASTIEGPDADGLGLVRALTVAASSWLADGGVLGLEIGSWQVERIVEDLEHAGLQLTRNEPGVVIAVRS